MKNRFYNLWTRIGAGTNPDTAFGYLSDSYNQPHRFYHNFNHIKACLIEFEKVRYLASNPNAVEFSIWYHDVVYNVRGKQNEEESSTIAYNTWIEAGLANDIAQEIENLILATKHNGPAITINQKLIVDIDLAILGSPITEFDEYENNIRKEYAYVPDEQFRIGRTAILKTFLEKPAIYYTDYFIKRYQHLAVANLQRSIAKLSLLHWK